jgi:glycosyltransferase involved in cell wall biosynthesis
MLRIPVEDDAYLIATPPAGVEPAAVEAAVRAAAAARPQVIVWDALARSREGLSRLRFGVGGLDDLLLAQIDLTGCCAVLESAQRRLKDGAAGPTASGLAQLARDPRLTIARAEGVTGEIDLERAAAGARKIKPAAHPDMISCVVVAHGSADGVGAFIHAFAAQTLTSRAEIVVVAAGLARDEARALSDTLDSLGLERPMRVRHFILPGKMSEATAVNTGLALAAGQAVIVARPACIPETARTVQILANWAAGADVFTASPRIMDGEHRLLVAGLYAEPSGPEGTVLRPWMDRALSHLVRRVAAPSALFFAVNRSAWLDLGGASAQADGLWTAELARTGKHVLAGPAGAVWTGAKRPAAAHRQGSVAALSADSARAMSWAGRSNEAAAARPAPSAPGRVLASAPAAEPAAMAAAYGFSDRFPSTAPLRLLVFADGFGASQALAFVDGLATARADGRAAVRVVEERALGGDGEADEAALAAVVEQHFAQTSPTVVVLSRFGHGAAGRLVVQMARARGLPVVAHLDDDLFDLPPIIGIERYRLARNPRRLQALHHGLAEADLVIAATPALAEKLARLSGHGRIGWMEIGSAGRPRPRSPAAADDGSVVIGYMGSASHNHDLEMIAPALNAMLERFDHVSVELFGSIAQQPAADLLRGRVRKHRPVSGDYQGFKTVLSGLSWDIGLAPLRPIAYNRYKTPTKWVEYAEAGAAVIVSDSEVYQPMIQADAAFCAGPQQWGSAMTRLIEQPQLRADLICAADRLLRSSYGWERLEAGVLGLLGRVGRKTLAA